MCFPESDRYLQSQNNVPHQRHALPNHSKPMNVTFVTKGSFKYH